MNFALSLLAIILSFCIIYGSGNNRFLYFVCGITFMPFGVEIFPHLHAARLLIYASVISIIIHNRDCHDLNKIPCFRAFALLFLSHLLVGLFDTRVGPIVGLYKAINTYLETFGCFYIGYVFAKHKIDAIDITKVLKPLALIIGIYSMLCFLLGTDIFCNLLGGSDSMSDSRNRIAGFFFDSHVAGFAISIYLLMLLFDDYKKHIKIYFDIHIILLFAALLLTKSRSSFLDFCCGILVMYMMIFLQSKKQSKYTSLLMYSFFVLLFSFLVGGSIFSQFIDAFQDDGGNTGGSTVALRLQQLAYSWELFRNAPWFGNGFQYFWEVINAEGGFLSSMLMGAESYLFVLLIERGIIQIILVFYFFYSIGHFYVNTHSRYSVIGLAILTAFLVNSFVTGNLYKWPFAFPFLGFYMRQIILHRYVFSINSFIQQRTLHRRNNKLCSKPKL